METPILSQKKADTNALPLTKAEAEAVRFGADHLDLDLPDLIPQQNGFPVLPINDECREVLSEIKDAFRQLKSDEVVCRRVYWLTTYIIDRIETHDHQILW